MLSNKAKFHLSCRVFAPPLVTFSVAVLQAGARGVLNLVDCACVESPRTIEVELG